jgi:ATP-dependent DNA helicase RecQ
MEKPKTAKDRAARASVRLSGQDNVLHAALRALRQKLAAEQSLPPYVIFHDRTLLELAEKRPQSTDALADITGLGERKIARYGDAVLEVIAAHKRHPLLENRLSVTVNQTLALHLEGRTADEIAATRKLSVGTIYSHFAEAIEAGLIAAAKVLPLDPSEIDEITAAFERLGTLDSLKLGPVHAALEGRYDFGILRCVLADQA